MDDNIAYINLDFFPPTAELLCSVPRKAVEKGVNKLCLRIIDNFPWDFDCRLRSFSSYDDSTIDFFSKECESLDLELSLAFPAKDDFSRLLRLNGYRRMADPAMKSLIVDPESIGFKSLIDSVAEDFSSLYQGIYSFVLTIGQENDDYSSRVGKILSDAGYRVSEIGAEAVFTTVESFLTNNDSAVSIAYRLMTDVYMNLSKTISELRPLLILSLLSNNPPSSGETGINQLMNRIFVLKDEFDTKAENFRKSAKGRVDPDWSSSSIKAYNLAIDDVFTTIEQRLKQSGLLN